MVANMMNALALIFKNFID